MKNLLLRRGFVVLHRAVSSRVVRQFIKEYGATYANSRDWWSIDHDRHRCQRKIESDIPLIESLKSILRARQLCEHRTFGSAVVIKSYPRGQRQAFHTDFDPALLEGSTVKPLSVILCLSLRAQIHYHAKSGVSRRSRVIDLRCGDALVFEGDFVHAGAAYKAINYRLHMYLNTSACPEPDNETYPTYPGSNSQDIP